jgi:hypothetical protein
MSLYVTVFAGSAPIGGFFAGAVAELWEAPAGFLIGGALSVVSIALVFWQLVLRDAGWSSRAATHVHDPADEPERRAAGQ